MIPLALLRGKNGTSAVPCFVGADLGPGVIRAAVFNRRFEMLGKVKLSSKLERGYEAVVERIARSVRYAIDECDLKIDDVGAVGVAVPGSVDSKAGFVTTVEDFGWSDVCLAADLGSRLERSVFVGNTFVLASMAIHRIDGRNSWGDFGVLFPGPSLAAGLVIKGESVDLGVFPSNDPILPPGSGNVVHRAKGSEFRLLRPRDIRKAVRKGDQKVTDFLRQSVRDAARFGAKLVSICGVRRLVLGGGAVDENKVEMVAEAKAVLRLELGDAEASRVEVSASELGDVAGLAGPALAAAGLAGVDFDGPRWTAEPELAPEG